MTQKTIKIFIYETYSKPPKKKYPTNKTIIYHIDDIWSLDILDLKEYGPEILSILSTITRQYNNRTHFSIKLTPKQPSLKNEGFVYQNLSAKRKEIKPKIKFTISLLQHN